MEEPLTIVKFDDVLKLDDMPIIASKVAKIVDVIEKKLLVADQLQLVKLTSSCPSPSGFANIGQSRAVVAPSAVPTEIENDDVRRVTIIRCAQGKCRLVKK